MKPAKLVIVYGDLKDAWADGVEEGKLRAYRAVSKAASKLPYTGVDWGKFMEWLKEKGR